MKKFFVSLFCFFGRRILSLRYNVKIKGLKELRKQLWAKKGGILFLPNHPAYVDPIILMAYLYPEFQMHPLIVEYMYRQKCIFPIVKIFEPVVMPDFDASLNKNKRQQAIEAIERIIQGVKDKKNYIIYPAGRIKSTGKEILGGASATHTILSKHPDAHVVLIRITGLWGSGFSRAANKGNAPNFGKTFWKSVGCVLKNLIFFVPRRKVLIEIETEPQSFPQHTTRLELNRYLEKWYNQYPYEGKIVETEPLQVVPYFFWRKDALSLEKEADKKQITRKRVFSSQEEEDIITELEKKISDVEITPEMNLSTDLRLDPLDVADMITFLDVHYNVENVTEEEVETVQDLIAFAEKKKKPKKTEEKVKPSFTWPKEEKRLHPELPTGRTIPEAFLRMCDRMGSSPACGDDMLGVLTYRRMKISVIVLSLEIQKIEGDYIGIMLPASSIVYILILATMLAGKVPVMLNWTLGSRYLNYMIEMTGVKKVLTSRKFLAKLHHVEFGKLTEHIVALEDLKKNITKLRKLQALRLSFKRAKSLLKKFAISKKEETDPAVILFTSGTETVPKAVPLSHKNILVNQRASLQCVELTVREVMLGCLPPFHSFGFSVAGLFPILGGMKIVFSPDPTASYTLAEQTQRWKVTMICAAPSFLRGILHAAKRGELKTVRLFVTGAEKTPKDLIAAVERLPHSPSFIEGYGITECSPVIAINRLHLPKKGVGQAMPGLEVFMVDPETKQPLEEGKEGEICVCGDSVFSGYLGKTKSPFIQIEGKRCYATGDLGWIDERGNIILSGRLKRFTKIGGEMVSLGAVEEMINEKMITKTQEGPAIAVCAKEEEGKKAILVLFTAIALEKKEINQMLRDAGFSSLIRISDIRSLDKIPMTGTGKTDYRYLQTLLE